MKLQVLALAAIVVLAGCGGQTGTLPSSPASQTATAQTRPAGHLIVMGAARNAKCKKPFFTCVTVSAESSAQVYFCYSTGSYCGPSQPQYNWSNTFITWPQEEPTYLFNGSFNPNPGDPTYDTISEAEGIKPTHGKVKYAQVVCPYTSGNCIGGPFYVGIVVGK